MSLENKQNRPGYHDGFVLYQVKSDGDTNAILTIPQDEGNRTITDHFVSRALIKLSMAVDSAQIDDDRSAAEFLSRAAVELVRGIPALMPALSDHDDR